MRRLKKRGQSTLEYLIVLTVIIAAIIGISSTAIKTNWSQLHNRALNRWTSTDVFTTNMLPAVP